MGSFVPLLLVLVAIEVFRHQSLPASLTPMLVAVVSAPLLALVLGTFAGSAYGLYSTQKAELETLAARLMQLDSALQVYGPETQPAREGLRKVLRRTYDDIWSNGGGARSGAVVTPSIASVAISV